MTLGENTDVTARDVSTSKTPKIAYCKTPPYLFWRFVNFFAALKFDSERSEAKNNESG